MRKSPTLFEALVPLIVLIGLIILNVNYTFGDDALYGANQMALLGGAVVACLIGWNLGFKWDEMLKGITKSIHAAMPSILILLLIGALSGAWLISGVTPALIYYGMEIMNPKIFLFAACVICIVVSLATGSSWTAVATVGVALVGIGSALEIHAGLTAGAIISGAYFGDKMSPLSDTTNLAPAMAGTDLFTHIRYMMFTTIPSITITLIIFLVIGFSYGGEENTSSIEVIKTIIETKFNISWVLFLVPLALIVLIVFKVKPIPAIFTGAILGIMMACFTQPNLIMELNAKYNDNGTKIGYAGGNSYATNAYMTSITALSNKTAVAINNQEIVKELEKKNIIIDLANEQDLKLIESSADLIQSKGMYGMLNTIWLILFAMIFGGIMNTVGLLARITQSLMAFMKSTWSLISTTSLSCIIMNFTASDQYIALVVPGKMYAKAYKDKGLAPENLSRTLEDSGTVTSVLCPWNTCHAYHADLLGFAGDPLSVIPYCFFNIISPIMTIIFAVFAIKIKKVVTNS